MDIVGHHLRAQRRQAVRPEPVRALHDALAVPAFKAYAWLGSAAPAVHLQAALVSAGAIAGMYHATYPKLVAGVLLCHVAHVLGLAGRRLDRLRGHDPWAHMLEQACSRLVEGALLAMLTLAAVRGVAGMPGWMPPTVTWAPGVTAAVGAGAAASLLAWHHLRGMEDLHLLRAHLLRNRRVPGPTLLAAGTPGLPVLRLNRERLYVLLSAGTLLGQPALTLATVLALYVAGSLATVARFRRRLGDPEPRSSEVLGRDYESP